VRYLESERFKKDLDVRISLYIERQITAKASEVTAKETFMNGSVSLAISKLLKNSKQNDVTVCDRILTTSLQNLLTQVHTVLSAATPDQKHLIKGSMFAVGKQHDSSESFVHLMELLDAELSTYMLHIPESWISLKRDDLAEIMQRMFDSSQSQASRDAAKADYKKALQAETNPSPSNIFKRYNNWFSTMYNGIAMPNSGPVSSIITEIFGTYLINTTLCKTCGHARDIISYTPILYLSMPPTKEDDEAAPPILLENCLSDLFITEELNGINQVWCSRCRTKRDSMKMDRINSTSDYLIIVLKRYFYENIVRIKNDQEVSFPLNGLDLSKWIVDSGREKAGAKYDLYATSVHKGGAEGGHYWAHCKRGSKWYELSDSDSSLLSDLSDIQEAKPYVLFYRRQDAKV
jgi:hypothetical protein